MKKKKIILLTLKLQMDSLASSKIDIKFDLKISVGSWYLKDNV